MKKSPVHTYTRRTGRKPITAQMASESRLRTQQWLKNGCNGFDMKSPISNPMAFWTEQDVLLYIRNVQDEYDRNLRLCNMEVRNAKDRRERNQARKWVRRNRRLEICSVYGEIVTDDEESGQMTLSDIDSGIFDLERPLLHTTGCERTGCMFCGYGCHLEKNPNRFEKMKTTHPKQYDFIMRGGHWKTYRIFNFRGEEISLRHCTQEQIERWVENNRENIRFKIERDGFYLDGTGLGYKAVIDWINEHGMLNIRY